MSSYQSSSEVKWTKQQLEAIHAKLGPVAIIAGPGTGKTLVLAKRFEYLVEKARINPERILVVSFTRKSVENLKYQIGMYICHDYDKTILEDKLNIVTFGQFFYRLFKNSRAGKGMVVVEEEAAKVIFNDACNQARARVSSISQTLEIITALRWICGMEDRKFTKQDVIDLVTGVYGYSPEEVFHKFPLKDLQNIYSKYASKLKQRHYVTFDDIQLFVYKKFQNSSSSKSWRQKFDAILVDEFQDVDYVQFEVLKKLCRRNNNIFVVGDPDQSIYGFRGAVENIFEEFQDHFGEKTQVFRLTENFRSSKEILQLSKAFINSQEPSESRRERESVTRSQYGIRPKFFRAATETQENNWIIEKIREIHNRGCPYRNIAILFHRNSSSDSLRRMMDAHRIPYHYDPEPQQRPGFWTRVFDLFTGASDGDRTRVFLSTIHGSKGLEFRHVFLIRFSRSRFMPLSGFIQTNMKQRKKLEKDKLASDINSEEIRLVYVAMSRAKIGFYITCNGATSEFLDCIKDKLENASYQ